MVIKIVNPYSFEVNEAGLVSRFRKIIFIATQTQIIFIVRSMKIRTHVLSAALHACLGLIPACRVTAQTLTVLHSFSAANNDDSNSDGGQP